MRSWLDRLYQQHSSCLSFSLACGHIGAGIGIRHGEPQERLRSRFAARRVVAADQFRGVEFRTCTQQGCNKTNKITLKQLVST